MIKIKVKLREIPILETVYTYNPFWDQTISTGSSTTVVNTTSMPGITGATWTIVTRTDNSHLTGGTRYDIK